MKKFIFLALIFLGVQQTVFAEKPLNSGLEKRRNAISKRLEGLKRRVLKSPDLPWAREQREKYIEGISTQYDAIIPTVTSHQSLDQLQTWVESIQAQLDSAWAEKLQRHEDDEFHAALHRSFQPIEQRDVPRELESQPEHEHKIRLASVRLEIARERSIFSREELGYWESRIEQPQVRENTLNEFEAFYRLKTLSSKMDELIENITNFSVLGYIEARERDGWMSALQALQRRLLTLHEASQVVEAFHPVSIELKTVEDDMVTVVRLGLRGLIDKGISKEMLEGTSSSGFSFLAYRELIEKAKNIKDLRKIVNGLEEELTKSLLSEEE